MIMQAGSRFLLRTGLDYLNISTDLFGLESHTIYSLKGIVVTSYGSMLCYMSLDHSWASCSRWSVDTLDWYLNSFSSRGLSPSNLIRSKKKWKRNRYSNHKWNRRKLGVHIHMQKKRNNMLFCSKKSSLMVKKALI